MSGRETERPGVLRMKVPQMGRTLAAPSPLGLPKPPRLVCPYPPAEPDPLSPSTDTWSPASPGGQGPGGGSGGQLPVCKPLAAEAQRQVALSGAGHQHGSHDKAHATPSGRSMTPALGHLSALPGLGTGTPPRPKVYRVPCAAQARAGPVLRPEGPVEPGPTPWASEEQLQDRAYWRGQGAGAAHHPGRHTAPPRPSMPHAGPGHARAAWGTENQRRGLPGPFNPFPPVTPSLHSTRAMKTPNRSHFFFLIFNRNDQGFFFF